MKAQPFPLSDLRLLPGSPFKHAMDKNGEWLLDLSADRLLHCFRLNAGLTPKGEIYGGWESLGVSGHTLGHYLSACAMMYASSHILTAMQEAYLVSGCCTRNKGQFNPPRTKSVSGPYQIHTNSTPFISV